MLLTNTNSNTSCCLKLFICYVQAQVGSKAGLETVIYPDHVTTGQVYIFFFASNFVKEFFVCVCSELFIAREEVILSSLFYSLNVILMTLLAFYSENANRV